MTLRVGASHGKSVPYLFGVCGSSASGDIIDLICEKTTSFRGHANFWVGDPRGMSLL